jgi:UDP-N-acetylglucosamine/UDP-N-acetylgalactosamine 4-epimerase
MNQYDQVRKLLLAEPRTWLITGVAGFIGSNLLETLLKLNQRVIGLDNFLTGYQRNLDEVRSIVLPDQWQNFRFIKGDIRDLSTCRKACEGIDYVLHQAALGSVPRSIEDPIATNENNLVGFLNILVSARNARVKRFVYASSSSVYGDNPDLPKKENAIGVLLSPYAVTKQVNETYADIFARVYGFASIGLRYFNVFGPRQDPDGPYAAVIPKWFSALIKNEAIYIYGDGKTSRDFCYVENAVQANVLAAVVTDKDALNQAYNIAYGERTTLNELFELIQAQVAAEYTCGTKAAPVCKDFRPGDIRHSLADIGKARMLLGYEPHYSVRGGLEKAGMWYISQSKNCLPSLQEKGEA